MIPLMLGQSSNLAQTGFLSFSWADLAVMFSVICAAYGWMVMHQLVVKRRYTPFMVNGFGMFVGGIAALLTSAVLEGWPPVLCTPISAAGTVNAFLEQSLGCYSAALLIAILSVGFLVIIGNIICYNLYGYLLHTYSATFISFAGFTTPIFAAIYGWFLLGEKVGISFILCLILLSAGLYLFYEDELGKNKKSFQ
jgi:drug/metabolite transporter (DMT)-like permease